MAKKSHIHKKRNAALKKEKRKARQQSAAFLLCVMLGFAAWGYYRYKNPDQTAPHHINLTDQVVLDNVEKNYGKELSQLASSTYIPLPYLKALIALECSGRTEFTPRFENHVFKKLKLVRDGKINRYGSIRKKIIADASDDALRNLATSWGPFQLMGYQCIEMDIHVHNIRGDESLKWGIKWIEKRYGSRIKREKFEDAFHMHNTGQPYPKNNIPFTHDPTYVSRGMAYMKHFMEKSVYY